MKSLYEHLTGLLEAKSTITPKEMDKICEDPSNIKMIANEIDAPEEFVKDALNYLATTCHDRERFEKVTNQPKAEIADYLTDEGEFAEHCSGETRIYKAWDDKLDVYDKLIELGKCFVELFLE